MGADVDYIGCKGGARVGIGVSLYIKEMLIWYDCLLVEIETFHFEYHCVIPNNIHTIVYKLMDTITIQRRHQYSNDTDTTVMKHYKCTQTTQHPTPQLWSPQNNSIPRPPPPHSAPPLALVCTYVYVVLFWYQCPHHFPGIHFPG